MEENEYTAPVPSNIEEDECDKVLKPYKQTDDRGDTNITNNPRSNGQNTVFLKWHPRGVDPESYTIEQCRRDQAQYDNINQKMIAENMGDIQNTAVSRYLTAAYICKFIFVVCVIIIAYYIVKFIIRYTSEEMRQNEISVTSKAIFSIACAGAFFSATYVGWFAWNFM